MWWSQLAAPTAPLVAGRNWGVFGIAWGSVAILSAGVQPSVRRLVTVRPDVAARFGYHAKQGCEQGRSAQLSFRRRGCWRWRTATWWRRIKISAVFTPPHAGKAAAPRLVARQFPSGLTVAAQDPGDKEPVPCQNSRNGSDLVFCV